MANDARSIAQELYNLLVNAASSKRGGSTSSGKKTGTTKEERDYVKAVKESTKTVKAHDAATKSRMAREKVIGKQYDMLIKRIETFGNTVEEAISNSKSLKQLDAIPKTVSKALSSSSSAFVKNMSSQVKNLEGVFKVEEIAQARQRLLQRLSTIADGTTLTYDEFNRLADQLKVAGVSIGSLGFKMRGVTDSAGKTSYVLSTANVDLSKFGDDTKALTKALEDSSYTIKNKFNSTLENYANFWKDRLANLGSWAAVWQNTLNYMADFEKQRQFGALDASTADAVRFGVSLSQLTDQIVDHRMTILAMQSGNKDAMSELRRTISDFRDISGSPQQALKDVLDTYQNIAKFGIAQKNLAGAAEEQLGMYNKNFRAMGYSMQQFNELTAQMTNDLDIRKQLTALNEKERRITMLSLQARYAEIQSIYGAERAMEIFRHEQQRATEGPLERLLTSQKMPAAFATLGLSREGNEYRQLKQAEPRATGEEKIRIQARLTELESIAAGRYEQLKMSSNQGAALAAEAAFKTLGIDINQFQIANKTGTQGQVGKPPDNKEPSWLNKVTGTIMNGLHSVVNAVDSSTIKLGVSVASLAAQVSLATGANNLLTEIRDAIRMRNGNTSGMLPDGKTGKLSKLAKIGRIGLEAATVAYGAYEGYEAVKNAKTPEDAGKGVGKSTGMVAGSALGATIGRTGGAWAGAELGATIGALGGPAGILAGGAIGALLGGGLGWLAGGVGGGWLGSKVGENVGGYAGKELSAPSAMSDAEILQSKAATEKQQTELLEQQKQLVAILKDIDEKHLTGNERAEEIHKMLKIMNNTTKAGLNVNREAIEKQTTDLIKKNGKNITMPITRGTAGNGNTTGG